MTRLDVVCRIPRFRALIASADGAALGFRGGWLARCRPPFDRVEKLARLPRGWKRRAAAWRLVARLLRLDVYRMVQTPRGTLIATSAQGIMRLAGSGDGSFAREFTIAFRGYRGSRPISLCVDGEGRLYFGEYYGNAERQQVHIYSSQDDGLTWAPCYTFPGGSIRHVHGLEYDSDQDQIWVLTGDYGEEAQIGVASAGIAGYRVVASGSQQTRACSGIPWKSGLLYATDTPLEQNRVYYLDRDTGAARPLAEVQQSVFFMGEACGGLWLSTIVEPSPVHPTQSVHVWFSPDGERWSEVFSAPRDGLSLRYFQYPAVFFARSPRACPYAFLSMRGIRGADADCLVCTIQV